MSEEISDRIFVGRDSTWQVNKLFFKVKVKNETESVITDINVTLDKFPSMLKLIGTTKTKYTSSLQPNGAIWTPQFELDAGNECISGKIFASVSYFDHKGNPLHIKARPFEISYICPLLEAKKIEEIEYLRKTRGMTSVEEKITLDEVLDVSESISHLKEKMEEMNLAIVNMKGKPNEIVGYAEDKVNHDGLALEATVETIKNNTSLILKVLCEHDNKCYPLIHKAVKELSNIGLSIDKSLIMQKLDIFIDKPNDLAKYFKRVIKSDWPDEKKDLWASVFREILEDWIKFNPNKWKKIAKILLKVMGSIFVTASLISTATEGIKNLYEWIKSQYQKSQIKKILKETDDDKEELPVEIEKLEVKELDKKIIPQLTVKSIKIELSGAKRSDIPTWKKYNLITVPVKYRSFFPGYKSKFILKTDVGDLETWMTGGRSASIGDPIAGTYITKNIFKFYNNHTDLEVGDFLIITKLQDKVYKLEIDVSKLEVDKKFEIHSGEIAETVSISKKHPRKFITSKQKEIKNKYTIAKTIKQIEIILPEASTADEPTWRKYNLIRLPAKYRTFFPGYKIPFTFITDVEDIITWVTGGYNTDMEGDPIAGSYVSKGIAKFYRAHPDLKVGDTLIITKVQDKVYKLEIEKGTENNLQNYKYINLKHETIREQKTIRHIRTYSEKIYSQIMEVAEFMFNKGKDYSVAVNLVARNRNISPTTVRDKWIRGMNTTTHRFRQLLENKQDFINYMSERCPDKKEDIRTRLRA